MGEDDLPPAVLDCDLEEGVAYLAEKASPEIAHRWHKEVMATIRRVEELPDVGRLHRDLKPPDIRCLVLRHYPRYLLFYRWYENTIEVLRIKHGMMDLPRLFAGDDPAK